MAINIKVFLRNSVRCDRIRKKDLVKKLGQKEVLGTVVTHDLVVVLLDDSLRVSRDFIFGHPHDCFFLYV